MSIDWQAEVESRKDDLLRDLFALLEIDSARDDSLATADAPVGPGPKDALLKFLEIANEAGFETLNVDNLAGHIAFGQGNETLGVLGHVDVVPAGNGWDTNPFEPQIIDGKIYARGASDDKGPTMAAFYALKIIKELGLPVSKQVKFIVGTDEESEWKGMYRYFEKQPMPDFGFSPDAEFPIINGEKGITTFYVDFAGKNTGTAELIKFEGGLRENMVPRDATATFTLENTSKVKSAFEKFIAANPVTGKIQIEDNLVTASIVGKAAHGMEPRLGINASTYLANFLNEFDFGGDAKAFIETAAKIVHEDSRAKNIGLEYTDDLMGDLTMNAGVFEFIDGQKARIALNFRFPQGVDGPKIEAALEAQFAKMGGKISQGKYQIPHYVPGNDPLVQTLLQTYEDHTGQKGAEKVIGGGTYGRLFKRGVAFGAMLPGVPDTMHQANEFMPVDNLLKAAAIYADAIYRLIK